MWGIRLSIAYLNGCIGITPTYVGNTRLVFREFEHDEDHPHVCGEYKTGNDTKNGTTGSPPRMWGILVVFAVRAFGYGITPTYVGNTVLEGARTNNE